MFAKSKIRIQGELSDELPIQNGVQQGNPISADKARAYGTRSKLLNANASASNALEENSEFYYIVCFPSIFFRNTFEWRGSKNSEGPLSRFRIRIRRELSDELPIQNGVLQSDSLSGLLFNIVLEKGIEIRGAQEIPGAGSPPRSQGDDTGDEAHTVTVPLEKVEKIGRAQGYISQENPFRRRICKVFSHDGSGDMTFDDFLDMLSCFSEQAPRTSRWFFTLSGFTVSILKIPIHIKNN
ncbi:calcium and integrin-binding family member 3 [Caerostris extrusa]|uniref:Calcium and integrin-binding family member 3 n=1 Tax=Caerostris extrusa TaxID=172846 RepID=A0AAV4SKA3_CAEEX|nr:calcium and integrin-binding family member 3 [Caerostris extrusa]